MATLLVEIDGTRAKQQARELQDALRKLGIEANVSQKNVGGLNNGLVTAAKRMASFVAATYGLTRSFRIISDFGHSMSGVEAVVRANGQEMAALTAQARELGATTQFTASQAADSMEVLGRAGLKTKQILAATPVALNLAAAASMEMRQAADITAKTMAAFQLEASRAGEVADVFAAAAANANTNVEGMGEAMKYAGPAAKAFNYSVADTAAAMGVLSDAGLQGTMAGTGLRRVLSELASPTKAAGESLRKLGIDLDSVNPATTSLIDIFAVFREKQLDAASAFTIFGDRGAAAALNLALMHDRLVDLTRVTNESEGEAKRMADTVQDNLWGSMKRLMSAVEEAILRLDDGMNGALRDVVDSLTDLVLKMTDGAQVIGQLFGGALKGISTVLKVLGENAWLVEAALTAMLAKKVMSWGTSAAEGVAVLNRNLGASAVALNGVAVAAVAAGVIVANAIKQWSDQTEKSINDMVRTSQIGREAIALLSKDAADVRQADVDTARSAEMALYKERDRLLRSIESERQRATTASPDQQHILEESVRESKAQLAAVEVQIRQVDKAAAELAKRYAEAGMEAEEAGEREKKRLEELLQKQREAAEAAAAYAAAQEEIAKATEAAFRANDPYAALVADLVEEQKLLNLAVAAGGEDADKYAAAVKNVASALEEARRAMFAARGAATMRGAGGEYRNTVQAQPVDLTVGRPRAEVLAEMTAIETQMLENAGAFQKLDAERALKAEEYAAAVRFAQEYIAASLTPAEELTKKIRENAEQQAVIERMMSEHPKLAKLWEEALRKVTQEGERLESMQWTSAFRDMADALREAAPEMAKLVDGAVDLFEAFQQIKATQGQMVNGYRDLSGYGQAATAVYGLGQAAGLWGPKGGVSSYGGQKEGNYASEGSQVGMVIGGIIGTYMGGQTQAGMAIGSAAGGMLGSFIKKGADEALAAMEFEVGQYTSMITKNEAGLGRHLENMSNTIDEALGQALAALGGTLESGPGISLKVRDDIVTVVVGQVKGKFEEMDDAISFAITEILKQGEISGMSESVRTAIANSTKDSLETLMGDIDFAVQLDRIGMDSVEVAFQDFAVQYRAAVDKGTRLGLDTAAIGRGSAIDLTRMRDQILGIEEDPAARIRREAAQFNAQITLLKAQETARLEDLRFQREMLVAEVQVRDAEQQLAVASLNARGRLLQADAGIVDAQNDLVGVRTSVLPAIDAAIAASLALLENLPDLISEGDIARAIAKARGGGKDIADNFGGHVRSFGSSVSKMSSILDSIRSLQERLMLGPGSPYTGAQRVDIARGEVDRLMAMYSAGGSSRRKAMEEIGNGGQIERFLDLYRSTYGTTGQYAREFEEIQRFLSEVLTDHGREPVANMAQASADTDAFARRFADSRGRLQVRDAEADDARATANQRALETSRNTDRMVVLLEQLIAAGVGGDDPRAAANRPAGPPQSQSFRGRKYAGGRG